MALTGREKATIFLALLGPEVAARILRYLPEELAELVALSVKRIPPPSPKALAALLDELKSFTAISSGEKLKLTGEAIKGLTPLEQISRSEPKRILPVLIAERIPVIAYILSIFPEAVRRALLPLLSEQRQTVEEIMTSLHKIPISYEIEPKITSTFAKKLGV